MDYPRKPNAYITTYSKYGNYYNENELPNPEANTPQYQVKARFNSLVDNSQAYLPDKHTPWRDERIYFNQHKYQWDVKQPIPTNNIPNSNYTHFQSTSAWADILSSKIGFINLGNTCYINSTLQILIHTHVFLKNFLQNIEKIKLSNNPISAEFYNILTTLAKTDNYTPLSPGNFIDMFYSIHPSFNKNEEQDTQEFCRIFLEDINVEFNRIRNPLPYKELNKSQPLSKTAMYAAYIDNASKREDSIITDTFLGTLCYEYRCQCSNIEYNFSQFLELPIQFGSGSTDVLNMLMGNLLQHEMVEMNEKCRRCQQHSERKKMVKITVLPKIVILSLQRIIFRANFKNNSPVRFEEKIDFKSIVDKDWYDWGSSTQYEWYGITYHNGSLNSGHYYAHVKIKNEWYLFNDDKIEKVKPSFYSNEAYTLFYMKRE